MNLDFSGQFIKEKYSKIKFREDPPIGSHVVSFGWRDRRTDGRDEANSPFFAVLGTHLKILFHLLS